MPIQIMELNISVSVNQPGTSPNNAQATPQPNGQDPQEAVVDECVEQVVKILTDKKER
ncbi:MAG TPA: DUF5908 family protein [Ohtaekwangia sp.]|uniref:DUF5908 family protein n=1 Tax=Ohtaekwangia sp. TaxID=2066019 RepID=UPI002F94C6B7